ncbi:MAG: TRAP transporter small permease subunit [Burkholderiales bacterium]|nr:TRAP transporter small permease subunit [Burkholderiales bacterium]
MLEVLSRVARAVERALSLIVGVAVAGLVVIVASQLVDRHLVTLPVPAPDQYARVLLVWLTFAGFALAVRHRTNIRVDLIDARLPAPVRRALDALFDVAMTLLALQIAWSGWQLVPLGAEQERMGTVLTEAWPAIALFGASLATVLFLALRLLLRLAGRADPVPAAGLHGADVD